MEPSKLAPAHDAHSDAVRGQPSTESHVSPGPTVRTVGGGGGGATGGGGEGGGSTGGGGNQSTGPSCSVYAWSDNYAFDIGDDFTGEIDTYCSLTNQTVTVHWSVINIDSNTTIDNGSITWMNTNFSETHSVTSTALATQAEGNYSFSATLGWTNGSVWETLDTDDDPFMVWNTTSGGGGNHSFAVRVGPASDPRFGPAGSARALQGLVPRPSTTIEEDESTAAIVEAARAARRSVKAGGKARRTLFVDVADGWVEQSRLLHREGFVGALEKAVSLEAVRDTMAALSKWPSSRGEWRTCASNALVLNKCMAVC